MTADAGHPATGRLTGKTAIVTGAARGIGEAVARRFVAEGAAVMLADILDEQGAAVAADLGAPAVYHRLDVRAPGDWEAAVADAVERFGSLDVLVNNAAVLRVGPFDQLGVDDFLEMVQVNQLGVFLGMQAVVPHLRERGGSIVNISSVDGMKGMAGAVGYAATKWAVRGMTKSAALELGRDRIRVNAIEPGGVETPMSAPDNLEGVDLLPRERIVGSWPLGRMSQPGEVAWLAVFLASDESSYCTGADFVVDGGQTAGTLYTT